MCEENQTDEEILSDIIEHADIEHTDITVIHNQEFNNITISTEHYKALLDVQKKYNNIVTYVKELEGVSNEK